MNMSRETINKRYDGSHAGVKLGRAFLIAGRPTPNLNKDETDYG
jgi:hypothetical protein